VKGRPDRTFCAVALVGAVGICVVGLRANADFYHDDAFIGLRYARNLISGQGLLWNQGERVEGYTNGLFTVLEAAFGAAGVDLIAASRSINILAFLALVPFVFVRSPRPGGERLDECALCIIPVVLVLTSFPLIVWTLGGLEGPFFAMLVVSATWLLKETLGGEGSVGKRLAVSGGLFGLACATRMDGLLFVATGITFLLFEPRESRFGRFAIFAGAFLAVFLPYFGWRLVYYGSPVPNTFWVKAAGTSWSSVQSGLRYVTSNAMTPPYLSVLAALALLYAARLGLFDRGMAYVVSVVAIHLSYVIYVGGDHMPAFRLLLPVIPLTALLLGAALTAVIPRSSRSTGHAALLCIMVLAGLQMIDPRVNPRRMDPAAFVGTIVGKHIASAWPPGSLVALNTAGSTPFYARDLRFVDMLGLNDTHIARRPITTIQLPWQTVPGHLKGDGEYVLRRRPDYIIIGPAEGATIQEPLFLSDLEMARDPLFLASYALRREHLDVTDLKGFERYDATRTGVMTFTYYERRRDTARK